MAKAVVISKNKNEQAQQVLTLFYTEIAGEEHFVLTEPIEYEIEDEILTVNTLQRPIVLYYKDIEGMENNQDVINFLNS